MFFRVLNITLLLTNHFSSADEPPEILSCRHEYKMIGCFRRSPLVFEHLLITDRDSTHKNYSGVNPKAFWENFAYSIKR